MFKRFFRLDWLGNGGHSERRERRTLRRKSLNGSMLHESSPERRGSTDRVRSANFKSMRHGLSDESTTAAKRLDNYILGGTGDPVVCRRRKQRIDLRRCHLPRS